MARKNKEQKSKIAERDELAGVIADSLNKKFKSMKVAYF